MKAILLAAILALAAPPALAHSAREATAPANAAALAQAPPHVVRTFAKRIRLTRVRMSHDDRKEADLDLGGQAAFAIRFGLPFADMGRGLPCPPGDGRTDHPAGSAVER